MSFVETYPLARRTDGSVDLSGLPPEFRGYHAHEWDRFVICAPSHREAARIAARLGWWLHCWVWEETGQFAIVDREAPEVLEARGREHRQQLLATPWFTVETLQVARGDATTAATRAWLDEQITAGNVFTVENDGQVVVPAFQLTADGEPRADLAPALAELAAAGAHGWELWTWMVDPTGWLSGDVPEQAARSDADRVAFAASRFAAQIARR